MKTYRVKTLVEIPKIKTLSQHFISISFLWKFCWMVKLLQRDIKRKENNRRKQKYRQQVNPNLALLGNLIDIFNP